MLQEEPKTGGAESNGSPGNNINLPNSSPVVSINGRWISSRDFADQFNDYLVDTNVFLEYPSYAVNDSLEEIE